MSPGRWLSLDGSATFQDVRNTSSEGLYGMFDGDRLPNRPWLFANASAALRIPGVGASNDSLTLSWFTRYVHAFLPVWQGDDARDDIERIPAQLTHAASLTYAVSGMRSCLSPAPAVIRCGSRAAVAHTLRAITYGPKPCQDRAQCAHSVG